MPNPSRHSGMFLAGIQSSGSLAGLLSGWIPAKNMPE
jgi:hypothetical protein